MDYVGNLLRRATPFRQSAPCPFSSGVRHLAADGTVECFSDMDEHMQRNGETGH